MDHDTKHIPILLSAEFMKTAASLVIISSMLVGSGFTILAGARSFNSECLGGFVLQKGLSGRAAQRWAGQLVAHARQHCILRAALHS
jgi:hypothetical protein